MSRSIEMHIQYLNEMIESGSFVVEAQLELNEIKEELAQQGVFLA